LQFWAFNRLKTVQNTVEAITVRERNVFERFWREPKKGNKVSVGCDYYNAAFSHSEEWKAHYTKSSYYFIWTVILDRLRAIKPQAVLEIGCGPGQLASAMHEAGVAPRYTGLDFSEVAIEFAKKACPPHFDFRLEDAAASNVYSSADYDTMVSTEFLEHVEQDLEILSKIRPGISCLATVPDFPYISHVRHFHDALSVGDRYSSLFSDLSIVGIRGIQPGTCFYLMQGTKT